MNIDRTKLEKLFDEHFIDEPSSEVFDAMNEIIDYAEKAVKLFAIPVVIDTVCRYKPNKQMECPIWKKNVTGCIDCNLHRQTEL